MGQRQLVLHNDLSRCEVFNALLLTAVGLAELNIERRYQGLCQPGLRRICMASRKYCQATALGQQGASGCLTSDDLLAYSSLDDDLEKLPVHMLLELGDPNSDVSRRRKLLEKQKEGRKRLRAVGNVVIEHKAFQEVDRRVV
jgi:hypothetical protein